MYMSNFPSAGDLVMDVYLRRMLWRFRRHGKGAWVHGRGGGAYVWAVQLQCLNCWRGGMLPRAKALSAQAWLSKS